MGRQSGAVGLAIGILIGVIAHTPSAAGDGGQFPRPAIPWDPAHYLCYRTTDSITIDGRLDEADWADADWTAEFVDIEGDAKPAPRFSTRVKMLWDEENLYVAASMEEPHVWGTLTDRDAVIYYDNDIEVFIDPDGDTHEYYELEINALGTEWDLLLTRPYRDGGTAVDSWDIRGLKSAVQVHGTLGDPRDVDQGWSIEIAIPWKVLEECARKPAPPRDGDQWRVNFSRVEWQHRIVGEGYRKAIDEATGKPLPESNWVWSPQGLIRMHYPERWGFVQFSDITAGDGSADFKADPENDLLHSLRLLYYKQKSFHSLKGRYALRLEELADLPPALGGWETLRGGCRLTSSGRTYEISLRLRSGVLLHIDEQGRSWRSGVASGRSAGDDD